MALSARAYLYFHNAFIPSFFIFAFFASLCLCVQNLPAAGPAAEPAELALLAPYAGRWTMEIEMRPTKFEAAKKTGTMIDETEWILGGKFLMRKERQPSGELMAVQIGGYDPVARELRFVMFQSSGNTVRWKTSFDQASKTFHTTMTDLPPGWTGSAAGPAVGMWPERTDRAIKNTTWRQSAQEPRIAPHRP